MSHDPPSTGAAARKLLSLQSLSFCLVLTAAHRLAFGAYGTLNPKPLTDGHHKGVCDSCGAESGL